MINQQGWQVAIRNPSYAVKPRNGLNRVKVNFMKKRSCFAGREQDWFRNSIVCPDQPRQVRKSWRHTAEAKEPRGVRNQVRIILRKSMEDCFIGDIGTILIPVRS